MIQSARPARQPARLPWSWERLVHERAVALGNAIDKSTSLTYSSALNSYLAFVHMHELPIEPSEDTLSFYVVYMSHHINPRSVNSYLSGICQQLESMYPSVRLARKSPMVQRTLKGCLRLKGSPTCRKRALTLDDLGTVISHYHNSLQHDDLLFVAMLLTGFFALMRLGELTFSNDPALHDWRKVTRRSSVLMTDDRYEFFLPAHKADRFFEGNKIVVMAQQFKHQPLLHFSNYIKSRDKMLPLASPLWLTAAGTVPTRAFFISRIRHFFDGKVAGQSMRAGGATMLAEHGVSPPVIQGMGRWSSEAFQIYVRKSPAMILGMLLANTSQSANLRVHAPTPL